MNIRYLLLSAILLGTNALIAQPALRKNDFAIKFIAIDGSIDSVFSHLGKPIRMGFVEDDEVGGFETYYYPGLIVWAEKPTHKISSFDVTNRRYSTIRGVKIGDSVSIVAKYYGRRRSEDYFERLHDNYDKAFNAFDEVKGYESYIPKDGVFYLTFFFQKGVLVKIYMHKGLGC